MTLVRQMQANPQKMNSSTLQNTIIMQRSVFQMADETMAAFHGWSVDRLHAEIANCARRMSESGVPDMLIKTQLCINDDTLRAALNQPALGDVAALASQVAMLTATVNEMRSRLNACEDEITRLRSERRDDWRASAPSTPNSRDRYAQRVGDSHGAYDDCGTWRSASYHNNWGPHDR